MRPTTDFVRNMMALAVRPEGVSAKEASPLKQCDGTAAGKRLVREGFMRWEQVSFRNCHFWCTPQQYAAWLLVKVPKGPRPPKDPIRVAAGLKGYLPKAKDPAGIAALIQSLHAPLPKSHKVAKPVVGAQWDRSAPAVITSSTRVTIWQPRTRAEWIADVAA